jgi:hypothetical protein
MNKLNKTHGLFVLFIVLILILVISPSLIKNMYSSFLGRICLVVIVLFFAMNNMTLGLLTALVFIIFSNMIFSQQEGLDNMESSANANTSVDAQSKEKDKTMIETNNVDLETIKNSIQSKPSSTLPTANPGSSENVEPATKEAFQSMYSSF